MPLKSKKCLQNSDFDIADHFAISFKVSDSVKLASMNFMQERMPILAVSPKEGVLKDLYESNGRANEWSGAEQDFASHMLNLFFCGAKLRNFN